MAIAGLAKRARFGQHIGFLAQADEYGGVAMRADAGRAARNGLLRGSRSVPMCGDDCGNGFSQMATPNNPDGAARRRRTAPCAKILASAQRLRAKTLFLFIKTVRWSGYHLHSEF